MSGRSQSVSGRNKMLIAVPVVSLALAALPAQWRAPARAPVGFQ